jgi:peptidyl-tRNA hydrolase
MSGFQTNLLTKKVTAKNAEEVLEVLKKIIDDAGLLEIPSQTDTAETRDE